MSHPSHSLHCSLTWQCWYELGFELNNTVACGSQALGPDSDFKDKKKYKLYHLQSLIYFDECCQKHVILMKIQNTERCNNVLRVHTHFYKDSDTLYNVYTINTSSPQQGDHSELKLLTASPIVQPHLFCWWEYKLNSSFLTTGHYWSLMFYSQEDICTANLLCGVH